MALTRCLACWTAAPATCVNWFELELEEVVNRICFTPLNGANYPVVLDSCGSGDSMLRFQHFQHMWPGSQRHHGAARAGHERVTKSRWVGHHVADASLGEQITWMGGIVFQLAA